MKFLINFTIIIWISLLSLSSNCKSHNDQPCSGENSSICLLPLLSIGSHTIGGSITGLTSSGLVLQNNLSDDLSVVANETNFTFNKTMNGSYSVTVKRQPSGLTCLVSNGAGVASSSITDINVTCSSDCNGSSITRNWATFTDCNNGSVKLDINAGTFGGNIYTSKTLFFAKCNHGKVYNESNNSCSGTASTVQFCNTSDNSCNGGINSGVLNSSGTSSAYAACNTLSTANRSWRVPTKNELKLLINCTTVTQMPNDVASCTTSPIPAINNLFPNTQSDNHWTSLGESSNPTQAWVVTFTDGLAFDDAKTSNYYLRCISD